MVKINHYVQYPPMRVAQNIDYPLKIQKIEKEERACKVREAALVERQQLLCHLPVDYPHKILH